MGHAAGIKMEDKDEECISQDFGMVYDSHLSVYSSWMHVSSS